MTTTSKPVTPILPHHGGCDVAIIVTFAPSDPIGATVVEIAGDDMPTTHYMALVEAAATRLAVYAEGFRQAAESDTA